MICYTCHNVVKDADWKHTGYCWKHGKITLFLQFRIRWGKLADQLDMVKIKIGLVVMDLQPYLQQDRVRS